MTKDAEHTGASSEDCGSANETPENDPLGDLALRGTHNWADLPDEVGSLEWQQRLRQISPLAWALWKLWQQRSGQHGLSDDDLDGQPTGLQTSPQLQHHSDSFFHRLVRYVEAFPIGPIAPPHGELQRPSSPRLPMTEHLWVLGGDGKNVCRKIAPQLRSLAFANST